MKGFTGSLRIELMKDAAPVSVTLIQPSAIGTPFPQHGRNLTGRRAALPPALYAPDVVARAILYAAEHPRRAVTVGGIGKLQVLGATMLPALFDRLAVGMAPVLARPNDPARKSAGNLYQPQGDNGAEEGRQHGRHFSLFTVANRHRWRSAGVAAGLAAAGAWIAGRARDRD